MGIQLGFGIIPFALSGEIHFGLQWDLNAHFSLLVQESAGLATVFVGSEAYGLGFQPSIALSFGAQCHF